MLVPVLAWSACSVCRDPELFAFKQGGGWFTELKDAVKALIKLHMNAPSFEMDEFMKLLAIELASSA